MLTFDQVCQEIEDKPASLLLGNGFSVAYDNKSFKYDNLKDKVFEKAFADMDVEEIMLKVSNQPKYLVECLKKGFINAISTVHPEWATDEKKKSCAAFLKHFSKVYTLNYDLLLYWAINSDEELKKKLFDGFGIQKKDRMPNWPNAGRISTFYLHGSLLLQCFKPPEDFAVCPRKPAECHIAKYIRPKSSGGLMVIASLIRILKNCADTQYPHFVSESDARQKYSRIKKCTYLKGCFEALKSESGNLVTYGVSFAKDRHILEAIKASNVKCCYVGTYGDEKPLQQKVESLKSDSRTVKFYNTETARVWQ